MGGNGSFASGINNPYNKYEEVGFIEGIKVLKGIQGHHKLPEESRTSSAYMRLEHDGTFKEIRFYNKNHKIVLELAYHAEPKLTGHDLKVIHAHDYINGNFKTRTTRLLSKDEIKQYKKYFKGVIRYD